MAVDEKKKSKQVDDEAAVLDAIAAMAEPDRTMATRLHAIIKANAPTLLSRTWYGMPAYSNGNKIFCFFRSRQKFGERFMTLGFNDVAKLDEGSMWPIYYAITKLTPADEAKIAALISKAVG